MIYLEHPYIHKPTGFVGKSLSVRSEMTDEANPRLLEILVIGVELPSTKFILEALVEDFEITYVPTEK